MEQVAIRSEVPYASTVGEIVTAESSVAARGEASASSRVYADGLLAGLVGATTIALWFLVVDLVDGRPFLTPSLLGAALVGGGGLDTPAAPPVSLENVLSFTWIHLLVFLVIGIGASRLLEVAERDSRFGFGILLLLVIFASGFLMANMVLADEVLHELAWPDVFVGDLLAAVTMATVFRRSHPGLRIEP